MSGKLVTFSHTAGEGEIDSMWGDVARGQGGSDWMKRLPDAIREDTLGKIPEGAQDVGFGVSLNAGGGIVFTASARVLG